MLRFLQAQCWRWEWSALELWHSVSASLTTDLATVVDERLLSHSPPPSSWFHASFFSCSVLSVSVNDVKMTPKISMRLENERKMEVWPSAPPFLPHAPIYALKWAEELQHVLAHGQHMSGARAPRFKGNHFSVQANWIEPGLPSPSCLTFISFSSQSQIALNSIMSISRFTFTAFVCHFNILSHCYLYPVSFSSQTHLFQSYFHLISPISHLHFTLSSHNVFFFSSQCHLSLISL